MGDKDVDAQFADIVAHWDDVESLPDPPDSLADQPPAAPGPSPTNPPPTRPFVVWRGAEPDPVADDVPDPVELSEDDDDDDAHFQPGPTAPLPPQEDLQFWGIVVGLVAGPLLLLWLVLFRPDVSGWWTVAALGLTVGGFVLLVLRQPQSRDENDPDNGARL
jgi:hypothetical protein